MNLRESTIKRAVLLMKDPQRGLSIKDRTFHFHVFKDCFVGQEFVTWTLLNSITDTREHAVMLGQDLLDRGIIFHASNDQPFRDGYFFYTFQIFPEITDAEMDVIVMRMKAHPTGVSIQDRTHHLRLYRDCFVGSEAVDWFIKNLPKHAPNRPMAISLGQELMNKGVMHSSTQRAFADSSDFYFFQKPIFAGYLGKLSKSGTDWKIRWFVVRDLKEKKLWYYNSPRDPVPRDFIPLVDACIRVVLEHDLGYFDVCTSLRIFTLRPTSSTLLARWVSVLSDYIGSEGYEDNMRMERAERSISVHECGLSSKVLKDLGLPTVGLSLGEVVGSGLYENEEHGTKEIHDGSGAELNLSMDKVASASSGVGTEQRLELMKDDLDIYLVDDDNPFPSVDTGVQMDNLDGHYGDGFMMDEVSFIQSPPLYKPPPIEPETEEPNPALNKEMAMDPEQEDIIARLSHQLNLTTMHDNNFKASSRSLIANQEIDILPPPPGPSAQGLYQFHIL